MFEVLEEKVLIENQPSVPEFVPSVDETITQVSGRVAQELRTDVEMSPSLNGSLREQDGPPLTKVEASLPQHSTSHLRDPFLLHLRVGSPGEEHLWEGRIGSGSPWAGRRAHHLPCWVPSRRLKTSFTTMGLGLMSFGRAWITSFCKGKAEEGRSDAAPAHSREASLLHPGVVRGKLGPT